MAQSPDYPPLDPPSKPSPTAAEEFVAVEALDELRPGARPLNLSAAWRIRDNPPPEPPVCWRESLAVFLAVVLGDLLIYRNEGFTGTAVLLLLAPGLLVLGAPGKARHASRWLIAGMLLVVAVRLAWCGSVLLAVTGFALLSALAMTMAGFCPSMPGVAAYPFLAILSTVPGLEHYGRWVSGLDIVARRVGWLALLLPLAALLLFASLFVMANPDLAVSVGDTLRWLWDALTDRLTWLPSATEMFVWAAVAWVAVGALRPVGYRMVRDDFLRAAPKETARPEPAPATLYGPARNTLVALIGLFAVYLAFEFRTLWFRDFPQGFYYAGYAHEGAAWLTATLGLATLVLSITFRGRVLADPRLARLRRLAWVWSGLNLLLALSVYNRLMIYIDFNGMTRMRTVGLFGVTTVVAGFVLVVWKIIHQRNFAWLWHRQLWALGIAVYLYAITPVDALAHVYNVRRVLAGDLAPSVQISVHPIDSEGIRVLTPLLQCDDEIIREGIRALLAEQAEDAASRVEYGRRLGWTARQGADRVLLDELDALHDQWAVYEKEPPRAAAWQRFCQYAYQWY